MAQDSDHERIARKAHEIWESEGHPHGRDQAHWDQAKEIIALHDSMGDTLLPRDTGAFEPEEPTQSVEVNGDMPGLTDQGRDDLVDIDREPENTKPSHAVHALGDTAGHVARSTRDESPDIDDPETITPAPKVAAVTPTPSNPTLGEPAPREAVKTDPDLDAPQAIVPKTASVPPTSAAPGTGPDMSLAPVGNGAATSGTTRTPAASPSGAKAPAGMASGKKAAASSPPTGAPATAAPAGVSPAVPGDLKSASQAQTSPVGNSAPVTAKVAPKPAARPAPVTKGKPPQGRR